ncbi:MAG: T9SS type A sorting domain-containing protein [candidate division Zixibacteria bacterium]|nr:T9SS type A sorting domain-containing protein [candidate division Zixibacteria bacterium]
MKISKVLFSITLMFVIGIGQILMGADLFEAPVSYITGDAPQGIMAADFDGDSTLDLACVNWNSNNLSVLIGNGDGTYAGRINYAINGGGQAKSVQVADMNGDGDLDLISGGSTGIYVWYNDGNGFFGTNLYTVIPSVERLVVADFNGDTFPDVATTHSGKDSVGIHLNGGDSLFTSTYERTSVAGDAIISAKLDIDSNPDLAVYCTDGTLWNLKNNGSGDFTPTLVHSDTGSIASYLAAADLNGNGVCDLAVANRTTDSVTIYFNNGDGSYVVQYNYYAGDEPVGIVISDFDADSKLDIVVPTYWGFDFKFLKGSGNGIFALDTAFSTVGRPYDIVAGDLDGDSYMDLALSCSQGDNLYTMINRTSLLLDVEDVSGDDLLPDQYTLYQNYPNPFNPITKIRFSLPVSSVIRVEIFNLLGQSIRILVDEKLSAGAKEVVWDGLNNAGRSVSSGIYFYRITANDFVDSRKMILLK